MDPKPEFTYNPKEHYLQELRDRELVSINDPEAYNWLRTNARSYAYIIAIYHDLADATNLSIDLVFAKNRLFNHNDICQRQEDAFNTSNTSPNRVSTAILTGTSLVALNSNTINVYVLNPSSNSTAEIFTRRGRQLFPDVLNYDISKNLAINAWGKLKKYNPQLKIFSKELSNKKPG